MNSAGLNSAGVNGADVVTTTSSPSTAPALDVARLAAVIPPLRRTLLSAAREREELPDIPDAQIEIIRALPSGVVLSPGELASMLDLNKSTVSNLLAAMERADLIVRRPRADDRRHVEVMASARALGLFNRFDAASASLVRDALTALSTDELTALNDALPVLERLRDALVEIRHTEETR